MLLNGYETRITTAIRLTPLGIIRGQIKGPLKPLEHQYRTGGLKVRPQSGPHCTERA